ncbi:MAG: bifunctional DNA-formamidopyrimidine glycosylase/DNA-(apurinic or apyrimidinic site) lyase [Candidatus Competibacteraceae bacterium]|nr:bifunctional DNA-formamidopyrimidine glycosylase/DNA-(apurinic or apyrimidinic site) lyase [Candidatus Competibacteraceae bacterium]
MPELPEVETTRQGIAPHLTGHTVTAVVVREQRLRWPVPRELEAHLVGQPIVEVDRRGKYLLLKASRGGLLVHLGMSGRLQIVGADTPAQRHDHVDILFGERCLRFTDPRRFGALLWSESDPSHHPLLRHLGPEPLEEDFHGSHLHQEAQGRRLAIKQLLMDNRTVVGVGNIYANEALFRAGLHPRRSASTLTPGEWDRLAAMVRTVLLEALSQGGTTLRDFVDGHGKAGYFQQSLQVYGRNHQPCLHCGEAIQLCRLGQRATYFCSRCQL